ncbi:MAG TPA: hypothetical protein VGP76_11645 [Planctomycetaceae bacterium]|jgi:nucleoside phosphorylase|nr:hypothetical protein [Planctomycetaceae bacterium]
MLLRNMEMFTLEDVKRATTEPSNWFGEQSKKALAGRCLLDSVEYFLTHPKFPAQFRQVVNAHTIRLITVCLARQGGLDLSDLLDQISVRLSDSCKQVLGSRRDKFPFYGDDFWDWAVILECFLEVYHSGPRGAIHEKTLDGEFESFNTKVEQMLEKGLWKGGPNDWYGPATAAAAYRALQRWSVIRNKDTEVDEGVLEELKRQSLQPIGEKGEYRDKVVRHEQIVWHLGQVVAQFPTQTNSQWEQMCKLLPDIDDFDSRSQQVYALARVLEGAHERQRTAREARAQVNETFEAALTRLYDLEAPGRPLGEGIIGDNVKGSLNVLEGLWHSLDSKEKSGVREMLQALRDVHTGANTVAIVVAIPREANAMRRAFSDGARITDEGDSCVIRHPKYRVVIRQAKSLLATAKEVGELLEKDKPKWVIMCGVAGSLGTMRTLKESEPPTFVGPDVGDVVLAVSLAPYRIRDKVRGAVENAEVPLGGTTWTLIPVDAKLFAHAHFAAKQVFADGRSGRFWEGQIVTGTGIKDDLGEKHAILETFPGGLAVEEEGFAVALFCMVERTPCIVMRAISDRAEGDKILRQRVVRDEDPDQDLAAERIGEVAVALVDRLSSRW